MNELSDVAACLLQHAPEAVGKKASERAITGTDADLRRLSMEDSKRQLMAMGMEESEVKSACSPWHASPPLFTATLAGSARSRSQESAHSCRCMQNPCSPLPHMPLSAVLSRWERINMVRTLSTAARDDGGAAGAKFGAQFARQERESVALRTQRNQERAQAIFNRQASPRSLHTSLNRQHECTNVWQDACAADIFALVSLTEQTSRCQAHVLVSGIL